MALLAIDVGNTQTVFGLFEGDELREHWRVATERNRSGDELGALYASFLPLDGRRHRARLDGPAAVPLLRGLLQGVRQGGAARARAGRADRRADSLRRPARGGSGPHRE